MICDHVHTTGIACPDVLGHEYDHLLFDGCRDCNGAEPEHDEDGYQRLVAEALEAHGVRIDVVGRPVLVTLAQVARAAYGWGWEAGHDDGQRYGYRQAIDGSAADAYDRGVVDGLEQAARWFESPQPPEVAGIPVGARVRRYANAAAEAVEYKRTHPVCGCLAGAQRPGSFHATNCALYLTPAEES